MPDAVGPPRSTRRKVRARAAAPLVADVVRALDEIAPFADAADWDNVGLLAGRPAWPGRSWLVALDLTDGVAQEALDRDVDGVLVYHPPIFKGVRTITPDTPGPTNLLPDLLAQRVAIVATHTAFDAAIGGTNDLLLSAFDVTGVWPLEPVVRQGEQYKLVVFVPPAEVEGLRAALARAGAGVIGEYDQCSFELGGRGTFRGGAAANPVIGQRGGFETVDELRLEMVVPAGRLATVVRALYATHSYDEPAFDVYPLHELSGRGGVGMGRVGALRKAATGRALLTALGRVVDLSMASCVGDLRRRFTSVTAAAGSFGVAALRDPQSLVLTGEFKHHDALALLRRGVTAIHLSHYASERPVLAALRERIAKRVRGTALRVARADRNPFARIGNK